MKATSQKHKKMTKIYELLKDISTPDAYIRAGERKTAKEWLKLFPKCFMFGSTEWLMSVESLDQRMNHSSIEAEIVSRIFEEKGLRSVSYKEAALKCIEQYKRIAKGCEQK